MFWTGWWPLVNAVIINAVLGQGVVIFLLHLRDRTVKSYSFRLAKNISIIQ